MGKINVLSSKIFNRIAAGEVVERPASVVKELIENSIDAGANKIKIEILDGGISSIKISDNGFGIGKDDLKNALLPHATSKISSVKDLDNICTLGFRGEALASIASVSKMEIVSKPSDQDSGARIYVEGGEIAPINEYPSIDGTEITVNNLFFNTPAREKFLRTPKSEEGEISTVVARFILGKPSISFEYFADNKKVLSSFGDGFESAMVMVYGPSIINDCFYIDTVKNGISIKGYIGKHYFSKPNRGYQTTFINDRFVINQTVSASIANAYSSYLMKRQYPFYVLHISVPTETVDVNVHPNKIDVRFANNQIIYSTLYSVISKVLDGSSEALSIVSENNQINTNENQYNYVKHNDISSFNFKPLDDDFEKIKFSDSGSKSIGFNKGFESKHETEGVDIFAENKAYIEKLEKEKNERIIENTIQNKITIDRELKYIGQALNTYLIFDDGLDMYLVDQHAAHERVLYDKFFEQINGKSIDVQPLLVPFVLFVNGNESSFIDSKIDLLKEMGFDISEFGLNTYRISSVPVIISNLDIKKFFDELLSDLNSFKSITLTDLIKEKIAQKACKSAIKSGDSLCEDEIKALMDAMKMDLGLKCPHGRPVTVKITRTEIDKWFKRIV